MPKKVGKLQIYCFHCKKYIKMDDEQFNWLCPDCNMFFTRMHCTRCGYEWELRDRNKLPKVCANPECHSPFWCRERIKDQKTGKLIPAYRRKKR